MSVDAYVVLAVGNQLWFRCYRYNCVGKNFLVYFCRFLLIHNPFLLCIYSSLFIALEYMARIRQFHFIHYNVFAKLLVMAQDIPCSFISSFLHNKDICYFGSFLVDLGRFQLTSTITTTFLLVELVVIKHGHHLVSCSYQQPWGGYFCHSWRRAAPCLQHYLRFPTLLALNFY